MAAKSKKVPTVTWQSIAEKFADHLVKTGKIKTRSRSSYLSNINAVNKANGGKTMKWIEEAVKLENPIEFMVNKFKEISSPSKSQSDRLTAIRRFGEYIIGTYKANICLKDIQNFEIMVCEMVASTAIFCRKEIAIEVKYGTLGATENIGKGNPYFSWDNCTSRRLSKDDTKEGIKRRDTDSRGIKLDDNSLANMAIKNAIREGMRRTFGIRSSKCDFKNFMACHIWDGTCYDERYHTSVANLVLLPSSIAGLSDYCDAVKDLLKYEAKQRFCFTPDGEPVPQKPEYYDKLKWRD